MPIQRDIYIWKSDDNLGVAHCQAKPRQVRFPEKLQSLTFGDAFNRSLDRVMLPGNLLQLTLGDEFNQSMEQVKFPEKLQDLTLVDG